MSGDGLRFTTRNIIFLVTTIISFGALYGVYFELSEQVRNQPLYLSLFIISTILFVLFLAIVIYDSVTDRDLKMENNSDKERMKEMHVIKARMPIGSNEYPQELVGKDKKYYNNSFEKNSNIWRTALFFIISLFIFSSFVVTYTRHSKSKRDGVAYIIALTVAVLGLAIHVGLLGYQIHEVFSIDRTESIPSIKKYQKRAVETRL